MAQISPHLSEYPAGILGLSSKRFPSRRAAHQLRSELLDLLRSGRLGAGEPFPTDDELAELTSLSRSTVRRAVSTLASEGWIERKAGRGSFVTGRGAEAGSASPIRRSSALRSDANALGRRWRIGVISYWDVSDKLAGHWFTPTVLQGLTQASAGDAVSVEVLPPSRPGAADAMRSLDEHPPDAVVSLSAYASGLAAVTYAQLRGIPAVGVGTSYLETDAHVVAEDNEQGMRLAAERLLNAGHTRIGFVCQRDASRWLFERLTAFENVLEAHGLEQDGSEILWLPGDDPRDSDLPALDERLLRYLERVKPTALISSNLGALCFIGHAVRAGKLKVPTDVSLVTFDQVPEAALWLGGVQPETVEIPLVEMGERAASVLARIRSGDPGQRVERVECALRAGDSVRDLGGV